MQLTSEEMLIADNSQESTCKITLNLPDEIDSKTFFWEVFGMTVSGVLALLCIVLGGWCFYTKVYLNPSNGFVPSDKLNNTQSGFLTPSTPSDSISSAESASPLISYVDKAPSYSA